ncbi:class I SAM-dependent rRNA methyltransferase [Paenibacillus mucilaginosus]|uniref:PUA domain-containing protein n=3 Tax=Paenibacillus mucilaginosus TaxID=61624 RepID=H6NIG4_9BACL|nr:class I SAM-dependent rRNA methyltransferase [Paenibacillus mucilaginosus]AFC32275.1 PUA domain-containing protein [Paenibacillus mucilaginosus 3016]AFH64579.1 SAM-dependent methyltransferase [Paenibacillus mucilaginosus K02]MCG7217080.1 class I SAM-dependent rRNA methyltransferase [Paenibacillus mucilaginosus]WDM26060.1 class I SAM-dependent rRNA methyltransferase [Paenibacillus mucilaginosus]WFA20777.1 class I SAM-dependent rRNA methyltransferase [Paenibacillus mucilaginosus]
MAVVVLQKKRKKRLEEGHPWVYQSEIDRVDGEAVPGGLVAVHAANGQYLATGYYNPASQLAVRIVSLERVEELTREWFVSRLQDCREHRERFLPDTRSYRLVYGEADFLPGLIVDKFEDVLVVQILTLGMERAREALVAALVEVMAPAGIYERSDVSVRGLEGLDQRKGLLYGEAPRHITIRENGLLMQVDIEEGQKTGYFFDQRENRAAIAPLMKGWGRRSGIEVKPLVLDDGTSKLVPVNKSGKEVTFPFWDGATVLECFSHTGSFTLHACQYGAKKVTCLDISEHAVETARSNVELNGFGDRVEFVVADAFDYLRQQAKGLEQRQERGQAGQKKVDTSVRLEAQGRSWDVVILDPPAFAKSRSSVEGACRGYKDINLHGMKLVNEGGYLVTASCSYHMKPELFLETVLSAAQDAGKTLRLVEFRNAAKDHPRILGVDEGNYLKFAIFEIRSRR